METLRLLARRPKRLDHSGRLPPHKQGSLSLMTVRLGVMQSPREEVRKRACLVDLRFFPQLQL